MDKTEKCIQEYRYIHFENEGYNGFLEDFPITLNDDSNLTKRETFQLHTVKTLAPYGLIIGNCIVNSAAMSSGKNLFFKLGIV